MTLKLIPHPHKSRTIYNPDYSPEQIREYEQNAIDNGFNIPGHYTGTYRVNYILTDKQKAILDARGDQYKYNSQTGEISGPSGKILKPFTNSQGYHAVSINAKGFGSTSIVVHRLAFALRNVDIDGLVVHHDNEIPTDNRLKNLIPMTERNHFKLHHDRNAMLRAYK